MICIVRRKTSPTDPISDKFDIGWGQGNNVPYRFRVQAVSNDSSKSPRRGKMSVTVQTGCKSGDDSPGDISSWSRAANSDGSSITMEIDFDSYYDISQATDVKHKANSHEHCYIRITAPVGARQGGGYDDAVSIIQFIHKGT